MIAVVGPQVVFVMTSIAVSGELAAGHRDKRAVRSVDDLQIPHHEATVDRDGAKCSQTILARFHQLDSNLRDFHD